MTNLKKRMLVGVTAAALAVPGSLAVATSASAVDSLTDAQVAQLLAMTAEEKLAGDVYDALAVVYPDYTIFKSIGASEDRHLAKMRELLATYGITDTTADDAAGVFDDAAVQQLYTDLVAQGSTSITDAADAGQAIETMDIADLDATVALAFPADINTVLSHLRAASVKHLAAFDNLEANPTVTTPIHDGSGKQAGHKGKGMKGKGMKGKGMKGKKGGKQGAKRGGMRGQGRNR